MKISTRTRYGTRLLVRLALNYGKGHMFLKDIAREESVSEKYLGQIILQLKAYGLVVSLRGAKGGYSLAMDPAKINMREVVDILEGGVNLVGCVDDPLRCTRSALCVTREMWEGISRKLGEALGEVTLKALADKFKDKKNDTVMYNI